ncbi:MAG: UbiX family flavin prenyltransferase [Bordetella sp.]|nr:MAG: UbiX family flavin prenyltransferase [Bordetella sp.]
MDKKKLIIGITGATGSIYAFQLLKIFQRLKTVNSHLIISPAGVMNIKYELNINRRDIESIADFTYDIRDIGATLASGEFQTNGMLVIPCSMRTLSAIANGLSDNLITRSADVTLKERRRLVLVVRETPFNLIHLRNMVSITEMGGIIFPPLPAFYHHPKSINEMVSHTIYRILKLFNIEITETLSWAGYTDNVKEKKF